MKSLILILISVLLLFGCLGGEQKKTETDASIEPPKNNSPIVVTPKLNDSPISDQPKFNDTTIPPKSDVEYTYYSSPLFFIYYPEGWGIDDKTTNGVFEFLAPLEDDNDRISEEFVVEIWEGNESTAEEFESLERQLMKPDDVVKKKETIQYKERDAFVMEIEGKVYDGNELMFYKTIFFRNGRWIYRLQYSIEKSKLDTYQSIMETILERFKIGAYQ